MHNEDSLNLWQGKRLTMAEHKVEQRLHVLRNNPTASVDLQVCEGYSQYLIPGVGKGLSWSLCTCA